LASTISLDYADRTHENNVTRKAMRPLSSLMGERAAVLASRPAMGNTEMIKWRSNLKSLTCSIAPLVIVLLAVGSDNIAIRSMPAQPHGAQIDYLANGADVSNQFKIRTSMAHRANRTVNSSKFRILVEYDQPDATACNASTQCDSTCCEKVSATIKVCAPADHNYTKGDVRISDHGYPCLDP
jgi:hypothetical protein